MYVTLWFDTEDYVEPASDDALLRLATDLTALNCRATFKIVGEKARVLEARHRTDVINALAHHDIAYHTNFHSLPPQPAVYLRELGFVEGAQEFYRRESPGVADLRRIFNISPSCYGQPGSSWGPQSYPALRRLGIPVYLDEGQQVGLNGRPFWYGGLLHVFNMGRFVMRPELNDESRLPGTLARFDQAAAELRTQGGGIVSTYYHPCEFATTQFWDGVNFARGADPERSQWRMPEKRTPESRERAFRILHAWVEHMAKTPGVRFVTARDLPLIYEPPQAPPLERQAIAAQFAKGISFLETPQGNLSPADMLLQLLGVEPRFVDGPATRRPTTYKSTSIPRAAFERCKADAVSYIRQHGRLPAEAWLGIEALSLADFAATLAGDSGGAEVPVRRGVLEFEKYVTTDPEGTFSWVIHPEHFRAPELLELGRLQAWTLKPARLRH